MTTIYKKIMGVVLLVVLLAGCSPVARTPMQKFVLSPERFAVSATRPKTNRILLINNVIANDAYSTNKMIYTKAPFNLKAYANHQWASPPAQMLQSMIGDALIARHYFRAVVFSPFVGNADYILSVRLLSLQQVFLQPLSEEHLALRVVLINQHTNQVIAERVFQSTLPAPGNNPYSGVIVANKMAGDMSRAIARFVTAAV